MKTGKVEPAVRFKGEKSTIYGTFRTYDAMRYGTETVPSAAGNPEYSNVLPCISCPDTLATVCDDCSTTAGAALPLPPLDPPPPHPAIANAVRNHPAARITGRYLRLMFTP